MRFAPPPQLVHQPEAGDYMYYHIPAPWLTVKLLRLLEIFPYPSLFARQRLHCWLCLI